VAAHYCRVEASCDLAELVQRSCNLSPRLNEASRRLRIVGQAFLEQAQLERKGNQPLLGSVVQIAFEERVVAIERETGGEDESLFVVDHLQSTPHTLTLDGQAATDAYTVYTWGSTQAPTSYLINVLDTGAESPGVDVLSIYGYNAAPSSAAHGLPKVCSHAGGFRGPDVFLGEEVVLDLDRLVRVPSVERPAIVGRGDGDGRNSGVCARSEDPYCDLAPVRY